MLHVHLAEVLGDLAPKLIHQPIELAEAVGLERLARLVEQGEETSGRGQSWECGCHDKRK